MRKPKSRLPRFIAVTALAAQAFLAAAPAATKAKADPPIQRLDARSFQVVLASLPGWSAKILKDSPGVLFQYVDEPARTDKATIGVFRLVVPAEGRNASLVQLGEAYAIDDLAGAQVALFKVKSRFMLVAPAPEAFSGGQLLRYLEEVDAQDARARTTKFVRAWVFFPKSYAQDGGLYLILGHETFRDMQLHPVQLERATEIIAGLHEP
jgi:hypothetical protein